MGAIGFKKIEYIFQSIVSIIYGRDDTCLLCNNPDDDYICKWCMEKIKFLNLKYNIEHQGIKFPCCSLGIYGHGLKQLILKFKYEKEFVAGEVLASYLSSYIEEYFKNKVDVLTFIPSSKEAYKKRGFNQCEVLCQYISKELNIPYEDFMKKENKVRDQIGLDTNKRWENVKDSFVMKRGKRLINKRVLLIDDVITSGATSFYGAKCLKDGGASEVYILTVAKSRV